MTPNFVLAVGRVIHVTDDVAPGVPSACLAAMVTSIPVISTQSFTVAIFPPLRPARGSTIRVYGNDWHDPRECRVSLEVEAV